MIGNQFLEVPINKLRKGDFIMKKIISMLITLATLIAPISGYAAEEEVTQTVLRTIVSDTTNNFCGQPLTNYGDAAEGLTDSMSYNGTKSYYYSNCKSVMRYRAWDKVNIANGDDEIIAAVEAEKAYICGWFYVDKGKNNTKDVTVQLISDGAERSKITTVQPGKWTFLSAKITNLKDEATVGVVDTNGTGTVYVDDLCIVSTSNGSVPSPSARTKTVAGATFDNGPNRYAKVLATVFNGSDDSKYIGPNGSNVSVDQKFVKNGFHRSLKLAGSGHNLWYLSGAKPISDDATLTEYANAGNLYWTAWMYIDRNSSSLSSLAVPGGSKKIGEWFWICQKITDPSARAEWINESGATIWLTDIKLMAFEDNDPEGEGLVIDAFDVSGASSEKTVVAGTTLTCNANIFNNSMGNEDVALLVAEYSNEGQLININMKTSTAITYRRADMNLSFKVSKTIGNKIKVFLWKSNNIAALENKVFEVVAK